MSTYIFRESGSVVGRREVEFTQERDALAVEWALARPHRGVDRLHDEPIRHCHVPIGEFVAWCPECSGRLGTGHTQHGDDTLTCDTCEYENVL